MRLVWLMGALALAGCDSPEMRPVAAGNFSHARFVLDPADPNHITVEVTDWVDIGMPRLADRATRHTYAQEFVRLQCGAAQVVADRVSRRNGGPAHQYAVTLTCPNGSTSPAP